MGFVKVVKYEEHPPCPIPLVSRLNAKALPDFDVGTIWQCDKCKRKWELVSIPARGMKGIWKHIES